MAVNRIEEFLQALSSASSDSDVQELCRLELEYLESSLALSSKKRALTRYRNSIKALDENHIALKFLKLSKSESEQIKEAYKQQVYSDHTNLRPVDSDLVVSKALELLETNSYINVSLGLMLLSGRRATEILKTANFQKCSETSVFFSGQLKTKDSNNAQTGSYEIPLLCDSDIFLEGFKKLRSLRDFSNLSNDSVHSKTSKSLSEGIKRHFDGLIDKPTPKDLRAIYALIAYDIYCPSHWSINAYFAKILGHSEQDLTTSQSYQDFYLIDSDE